MTINEMIQQLTELKENFDCGEYKIAMCKGVDEFGSLCFREAKKITLNFNITETSAEAIIWGN